MKELPHDLLAEKSLLGCLIIDGTSYDELGDLTLVSDDFYHPQYRVIFDSIRELSISNRPIDYVTVCSHLSSSGKLEEVGGESTILNIVEDQASAANIYHYGRIVKDKASIRNLIRAASRIAERGMTFPGTASDFITEAEASFFKLTNSSKSGKLQKLSHALKENLRELGDPSIKSGEIQGLSTGYKALDEKILGMRPGQLIILAARPAMGKTALALNMAIHACERHGLPVAIFSLEMLAPELSMRMLSSKAKVDSKRIKTKNFLDTDFRNITNTIQGLNDLPIFINDQGADTLPEIQSHCRKLKAEFGLGLIVIDYLQLMRPHSSNPSREQQISEISRGLKAMAKELGCPVMTLSQLNRRVEGQTDKRPNLSDLRESGSIEQDADIVLMIYRDDYYNKDSREPGVAEIIIGKNRSGETGTAKLAFVGAYTSFENLSYAPAPSERN